MDRERMAGYGIDIDRGIKNCMGNPEFYKKILSMFLVDQSFARAKAAYLAGEWREMFGRVHELKGISGNAGLLALYDATVPLVELLRPGGAPPTDVERRFAALEAAYLRAREGIYAVLAER